MSLRHHLIVAIALQSVLGFASLIFMLREINRGIKQLVKNDDNFHLKFLAKNNLAHHGFEVEGEEGAYRNKSNHNANNEANGKAMDENVLTNKGHDVKISLAVVASAARSSSTFTSSEILGKMQCHVTLDEILSNLCFNATYSKVTTKAWETAEAKELHARYQQGKFDSNELANFILNAGKRQCKSLLSQKHRHQKCDGHCWVNYKHFPHQLQRDEHYPLWDSLFNLTGSSFGMIILERPVEDRWRSSWYSKQTGDWNTRGDADHKHALAAASVPNIPSSFRSDHEEWFSMVRQYAESHRQQFPVLDLSFNQTTESPVNVTRAMVKRVIEVATGH